VGRPLKRHKVGHASRNWRATPRLLVAFGLAALGAAGLCLLLDSAYFELREVTVTGLNRVTETEVLRLSGLKAGTSIWRVSPAAVSQAVKSHPRVLNATVKRELPSRLRIEVSERVTAGVIPYYAAFLEVDATGRVLGLAEGRLQVPVITGVDLPRVLPGDELGPRLWPALEVLRHLGEPLSALLAEVHLTEDGEVVVYTAGAVPVYLGRPQALAAKVEVMVALLAELARTGAAAEYIDLRNVGRPLVKLREGK